MQVCDCSHQIVRELCKTTVRMSSPHRPGIALAHTHTLVAVLKLAVAPNFRETYSFVLLMS